MISCHESDKHDNKCQDNVTHSYLQLWCYSQKTTTIMRVAVWVFFLLFEYLIPDTPLFQLTLVLTVLVANVQCTPFIFGLLGDDLDHLIS